MCECGAGLNIEDRTIAAIYGKDTEMCYSCRRIVVDDQYNIDTETDLSSRIYVNGVELAAYLESVN
jgi:hypothetical protein